MSKKVLLVCSDFLFASRILETARQLAVEIVQVRSDAGAEAQKVECDLAIVDLAIPGAIQAIGDIRQVRPGARIVAFVRHEEVDAIRAARQAGASDVLARGAFSEKLPELLGSTQTGAVDK